MSSFLGSVQSDGSFLSYIVKPLANGKYVYLTPDDTALMLNENGQRSSVQFGISWGDSISENSNYYDFFAADVNYSAVNDQYLLVYGQSGYKESGDSNCKVGIILFDSTGKRIKSIPLKGLYREQTNSTVMREESEEAYAVFPWKMRFLDSFYDQRNPNIFYISGLRTKEDIITNENVETRPNRCYKIDLTTGEQVEITDEIFAEKRLQTLKAPIEFSYKGGNTYVYNTNTPNAVPLLLKGKHFPIAYSLTTDGNVYVIMGDQQT